MSHDLIAELDRQKRRLIVFTEEKIKAAEWPVAVQSLIQISEIDAKLDLLARLGG